MRLFVVEGRHNVPLSQFSNIPITVRARPLLDVMGQPVTPYPLTIGAVIQHWCDLDLAAAWFAYALRLLSSSQDTSTGAFTPAAISAMYPGLSLREAQQQLVFQVLNAICMGFNALNIVWWNQPDARAIYRRWMSGMPPSPNGQWKRYVFGPAENYGGECPEPTGEACRTSGWFTAGIDDAPITHSSPLPGGILPRLARRLFDRYYWPGSDPNAALRHPTLFIPSVGLTLTTAPGTHFVAPAPSGIDARPLMVELANEVQNTFWVMLGNGYSCPSAVTAYPRSCELRQNQNTDFYVGSDGFTYQALVDNYVHYNAATDFRFNKSFAEINRDVELGTSLGFIEFLPYLFELTQAMNRTRPIDLIQDSRAFVIYQNLSFVRAAETSLGAYLAAVFGSSASTFANWIAPDATAGTAASLAFTIGAAAAPYTYGISAIIGGAAGAAITIADALTRHKDTAKKDDLGRLKPIYERAWLSGSQDPYDLDAGAPVVELPVPPGYVRIPNGFDLEGRLTAMQITCAEYLALDRATRFVYVGSLLQHGPYTGGAREYAPPTDYFEIRDLGRLVDAMNAHCVRVGFAGPPTNPGRPPGGPPIDDPYGDPALSLWGPWLVGAALFGALWKIFSG